ncbi:MAG: NAD-dependent epimerase/dehydratase family protein [Deltaproteobacteria bacterium]|nr:NAD-dependent epimerase/dehydratase family protein [Deltaproteobacteria bacterium]MBF0523755.1 NAD-dependent epimerase/dehydratase family protein [Deltaproteobacteria bacterium]
MSFNHILITGGCGFVGASLAVKFRQVYPQARITCLDNLKRRGSELNLPRLQAGNIEFIHGDIRNPEDFEAVAEIDLILECSAEPSVLAGYQSSPGYLINTNLMGTVNCLEFARRHRSTIVFLSTSRVYPFDRINALRYDETATRFELAAAQDTAGVTERGYAEDFPLDGPRSLYGATKLASELLILEYVSMYGLKAVINRCGVLTGPGQFGKVDQGVVVLWVAKHYWRQPLSYIGFGGEGKQVRDILHVDDLFNLLILQLQDVKKHNGQIYNVGGGRPISLSLLELTDLCREVTGRRINIAQVPENRPADIRIYLTDNAKVTAATGWTPQKTPLEIITEIHDWIRAEETTLERVLKY